MSLPKRNEPQKRSRIQERKGAAQYGGKQNSGSGNGWIRKADVRTEEELIEFKTTSKSRYPLDSRELSKFWQQALIDDLTPVFEIEFADDGMTCVVLDKNDFLLLRKRAAYPFPADNFPGHPPMAMHPCT
jgi:hypothetical protein